jgi:hypothetical protein
MILKNIEEQVGIENSKKPGIIVFTIQKMILKEK